MNIFQRLLRWWRRKSALAALPSSSAGPMLDAFRRVRPPTATELLGELKNTAYTCASINAAVCAAFPPKLYVATTPGESVRWPSRAVDGATARRLTGLVRETAERASITQQKSSVLEVTDHPLLT